MAENEGKESKPHGEDGVLPSGAIQNKKWWKAEMEAIC